MIFVIDCVASVIASEAKQSGSLPPAPSKRGGYPPPAPASGGEVARSYSHVVVEGSTAFANPPPFGRNEGGFLLFHKLHRFISDAQIIHSGGEVGNVKF